MRPKYYKIGSSLVKILNEKESLIVSEDGVQIYDLKLKVENLIPSTKKEFIIAFSRVIKNFKKLI